MSQVNQLVDMNKQIEQGIIARLKGVYDPEIPVNIFDLGLIYNIAIDDVDIKITMTLTSAFCPSAEEIPAQVQAVVEKALSELNTTRTTSVEVVFDPPWTPERVSEEAKLEMGMYDYDQENYRLDPWEE
jgi:metal-sulfur cluster biosynthetic enzyme